MSILFVQLFEILVTVSIPIIKLPDIKPKMTETIVPTLVLNYRLFLI